MSHKTYWV